MEKEHYYAVCHAINITGIIAKQDIGYYKDCHASCYREITSVEYIDQEETDINNKKKKTFLENSPRYNDR